MAAENAAGWKRRDDVEERHRAGGTRHEAGARRLHPGIGGGRHVDSRGEAWRRGKGRGNLQKFRQCNKVQGMNRVSGRAGDDKKSRGCCRVNRALSSEALREGWTARCGGGWWFLCEWRRDGVVVGEGGTKLAWPSTGTGHCPALPVSASASTRHVPGALFSSSSSCVPLFVAQLDRLGDPQFRLLVCLIGHTHPWKSRTSKSSLGAWATSRLEETTGGWKSSFWRQHFHLPQTPDSRLPPSSSHRVSPRKKAMASRAGDMATAWMGHGNQYPAAHGPVGNLRISLHGVSIRTSPSGLN